jgi:tetratricopeptide (TPR) repeat protein
MSVVAFVGCSSAPPEQGRPGIDETFERTNRAARRAYDNGKLQQALDLYNQALERAYVLDDLNAIVDSQYNLAVCLTGLHSYEPAIERVKQAKAELARADQGTPADILLLEAIILHRMGRPDEAWRISDEILLDSSRLSEAIQSKTHFLRGLIASTRQDTAQLRIEIAALGEPSLAGLRADRAELIGRLAAAQGSWEEAVASFDSAAELRREDFDYNEMAKALAMAARACEQAGRLSDASKRYLRAGRSASLQGQNRDALKWLGLAEKLAGEAGDELTASQARSYRKSIQEVQPAFEIEGQR